MSCCTDRNTNDSQVLSDDTSPGSRPSSQPSTSAATRNRPVNHDASESPKKRRACERCHRMKVLCKWDSPGAQTCVRCVRSKRQCILTQRQPNRRDKSKADIVELQKKIDALSRSLEAMKSANGKDDLESDNESRQFYEGNSNGRGALELTEIAATLPEAFAREENGPDAYRDVVDQGILSLESAQLAFAHFIKNILPIMPIVFFPDGISATDVRRRQPALFLAIVNTGSNQLLFETQQALARCLMTLFSEWIILKGEKSLDVIQALQVATLWYNPPRKLTQLNFFLLQNLAGVMAIDLGLNKQRNVPSRETTGLNAKEAAWKVRKNEEATTVETRRTWLTCYFLSAGTAQNLRRPNLMRWTPFCDECVEFLETSPSAVPSDKFLCQWIRIQHVAEEVGVHFSIEDPSRFPETNESKIRYMVKGFETQLRLVATKSLAGDSPYIRLTYEITNLFLHEVAMHIGQHDDGLQPPFTEDTLNSLRPNQNQALTAGDIDHVSTCLTSVQVIFAIYLSIPIDTIRVLPSLYFVRLAYTILILIKIYLNAAASGEELSNMFSSTDFDFDDQLLALSELLAAAGANEQCQRATRFTFVVNTLRKWYFKQRHGRNLDEPEPEIRQSWLPAYMHEQNQLVHQQQQSQYPQTITTYPDGTSNGQRPLQLLVAPDRIPFADQDMFDMGDLMSFDLSGQDLDTYLAVGSSMLDPASGGVSRLE